MDNHSKNLSTQIASQDLDRERIDNEIYYIRNELGIDLSDRMRVNIMISYRDVSSLLRENDVKNSLCFIKNVFYSLLGTVEGLNDYINNKYFLAYSSYSRFRIRLAIFNHFGFLKEVFLDKPELLVSKSFDVITTADIYRILSNNSFDNLDDFISYVNSLSIKDKEKLRTIEVEEDIIKSINDELMETLKSLRKKNEFINIMSKKKK